MCGIAGKLNFDTNNHISIGELKSMTDAIIHRGPDDEGHFINKNVGLGFRRLSIIDLESGHQPLSNHDESVWITFNGEIYNYKSLRAALIDKGYKFKTHADTEVILHLYEEHGEACVSLLEGMFAFVIWDGNKKQIFGARDRFGIKPFYYYLDNEKFVWGSEIKAITASGNIDKSINFEGLDSYFTYGYIMSELSIFKKIKKLEPSTCFTLNPSKSKELSVKKYWDINFQPDNSVSEKDWIDLLLSSLKDSVEKHMISDVPIGAFLSGGIDSSSVVALMKQFSSNPIKTFSIGFKEEKYNELIYARQVAKLYGTEHHELIVEPESVDLLPKLVKAYDEPFADSSAIPTYYLSSFTREYVKVALSGDGGDELFAGYNSYLKMVQLKNNPANSKFTNRYIFSLINKALPDHMFGKGYSYLLSKNKNTIGAYFCMWKDYERSGLYNKFLKGHINNSFENRKVAILDSINGNFLSKMQALDMKTYLIDDILTKVDRASMMNSLEVRVPLLDHKLAELTFKIPSNFKMNEKTTKYIFKQAMKPFLPGDVFKHKKQGFAIPLKIWFKDDLKAYTFDVLGSSKRLENWLDKDTIKQILNSHQKGVRDYSDKIWSLLILNEWMKQNNI